MTSNQIKKEKRMIEVASKLGTFDSISNLKRDEIIKLMSELVNLGYKEHQIEQALEDLFESFRNTLRKELEAHYKVTEEEKMIFPLIEALKEYLDNSEKDELFVFKNASNISLLAGSILSELEKGMDLTAGRDKLDKIQEAILRQIKREE